MYGFVRYWDERGFRKLGKLRRRGGAGTVMRDGNEPAAWHVNKPWRKMLGA